MSNEQQTYQQPVYEQPVYQQPVYQQPYAAPVSQFTGGLLGLIGINILMGLLCAITLGIGTPWALCMKERWIAKHTYIDGRQLRFDGTGGQLLGKFLLWVLLTIITFGIYSFWLEIKMKAWLVKHTHFA